MEKGSETGVIILFLTANNCVKFTPRIVNLGYDCAIKRQVELV